MIAPSSLSRFAVVVLAVALTGCQTMGPNFVKPTAPGVPAAWTAGHPAQPDASAPVAEPPDPHWWTLFHDPELTWLEAKVAAGNLDVQQAAQRLAESRASLGVARAGYAPDVNGNANYTKQQLSKTGALALASEGPPGAANNGAAATSNASLNTALFQPFNLYQYGFDAAWEIDFWGRVKRNVEASSASVAAAAEAQRETLLAALGELARDYVQLRGVQRNLEITRSNLDTAKQSLKLTTDRAEGGLTTDLDVASAAAQVANTASQIPNLEARQDQLINAIALLLGQPPRSLRTELVAAKPIPPVPPHVPVGLPSELARRRPDIRRVEAQLHAATAEVGVAVADFYPRVTLAASGAIQATQFSELGSWGQANTWAFGPSLTLPIFEGGKLKRALELRKAQQQEAAIAYHATVLNALHEVDNALTAYQAEQQRRVQLRESAAQNRRALKLAQDRYQQGVADFLAVLDAERSLLAAEQALTDSTTAVSTDLVQIYKALGGGWESDFPDVAEPPDEGFSLKDISLKDVLP